jgi:lipoate---protein ligase
VWVTPGEFVWIDVDLPRGDRLWEDDVSRSFLWLGRTWAAALAKVGVKGATVWEEALWCGPAGRDICFATQAPGEVSVAGRKVVGITQRRTRAGSRFHCAALLRWNPAVLARAMAVPESAWPELNELAGGLDVVPDELVAAFVEALPR